MEDVDKSRGTRMVWWIQRTQPFCPFSSTGLLASSRLPTISVLIPSNLHQQESYHCYCPLLRRILSSSVQRVWKGLQLDHTAIVTVQELHIQFNNALRETVICTQMYSSYCIYHSSGIQYVDT